MRPWWLLVAGIVVIALTWFAFNAPLTARDAGDLLALALVVFWLGVPWIGVALTTRAVGAARARRHRSTRG